MTYEVSFTDSVNKGSLTVDDNTVNTDTSLQLPGRNLVDYGNIVLENFLHLLENFASNSSPENPVEGQLWYDTTDGIDQLKVYDGTQWVSAGGLKKSTTEPEAPTSTIGDLWVDTANQQVYLYSGSGWVLVGPDYSEGASTGAKYVTVVSTTNVEVPVIINYVNNVPVSIVSSIEFIPKSTIQGFGTLYPGVNISGNISGSPAKYYGLAEKAENLVISGINVPGTDFVRKSTENILTKTLRIRNNGGLDIGETQTLVLSVSGSTGEISHKASDGGLDIKVNNAGISTTAIRIYNDTKVAIGSPTKIPTEALDVVGNIVASGTLALGGTTESTAITTGALIVPGGAGIAKNLNVGGSLDVNGSVTVNGNITPETTGTTSIGTSALRFNNIYATNLYGTFVGSLTGNVTGASTRAGKLNSPTTFVMTGDITAPSFVFDGQTGGSTKTFTTTLSDNYFTSKDIITNISDSDQIIIRRLSGTDIGLKRVSQSTLTSKIPNTAVGPVIPVGAIMPYAGVTAPDGWFICDGSEKSKVSYSLLFTAIGEGFGAGSTTSLFKIPDFRGRFPIGYRAGAASGNRVLSDPAVDAVGQYGGSESDFILENQLPEHKHSLMGDQGTQFYATTNDTGVTDTSATSISSVGGDPGSGLPRTEGIDNYSSQIEFTTVPPFATVNFIIYHGVFI